MNTALKTVISTNGRNPACFAAIRARLAVPLHIIILSALIMAATPPASAEKLGRLFFTSEQRARLDHEYAREMRPDSDNRRSLSVTGIVQKHGGERTIWINGVPQPAGKSDERSPESAPVTLPGQKKPIRVKVGQKVFIQPAATEE